MDGVQPIVEVRGATVRFGADAALDRVDFRLFPGEVHSLMGENGAGKSTLIKAITGALALDEGTMSVGGRTMRFGAPHEAREAGIGTVYQEVELLPNLSVAENVMLGREPRRAGVIHSRLMQERAREALAELGIDVDPASMLGSHSLAVQQLVAIARALTLDLRVLVLDEPTSSLDLDEVAELFRVIRDVASRGVAVLFVSHFLDQVYEISDRVTVLRDGKMVGEYLATELLRIELVQKMLGTTAAGFRGRVADEHVERVGEAVLDARGLSVSSRMSGVDLSLHEGEVLGLAGLLGSGRTTLARALTGVSKVDAGIIRIDRTDVSLDSPRRAIEFGVVYSSEDRRRDGIVADLSVLDNITLALQAENGIFHRIPDARRRELAMSWVQALGIRPPDLDRRAGTLSGGNQQKVLLARLLALSPRVLVLDEPTRGIDVGSKVEVQNLVGELADNGISVIYISAELEEVLRVGDRVAVVRAGRIVETVEADQMTPDALLALVAQPDEDGE